MNTQENKAGHCSQECIALLTITSINMAFKTANPRAKESIAACFYACWYSSFIASARVIYSSYSAGYVNEAADISFTDAMMAFTQRAATEGLYQSSASARSVAFKFFENKLHEYIRKDKPKKNLGEEYISNGQVTTGVDEEDEKERLRQCFKKIQSGLPEEDVNICKWKFEEKLSNSEIASKLGITTQSFTNRFYRLSSRLEKLITNCLKSVEP